MAGFWVRFACDDSGASAIEYGLIAALIAVVIIGGATALGTALNAQFSTVGSSVTSAGA
jgi:pilus assembly protein Flp/PilA